MMRAVLALAALLALAAGCGTLPDATPFAEASSTLVVAVKSSGQAISDSLRAAGSATPPDTRKYDGLVDRFDEAWAERVKAVQGVAAYSDAIADVISAGREGEQTVNKVAASLKDLASAVNIPVASPAVGVAGDIARFIAARVAVVEASRKLEDALVQAQPAIDRIAEKLASDSQNQLKPMLQDAYKNIVSGIKSQHEADDNFVTSSKDRRLELRAKALKDPKAVQELGDFDRVLAAALSGVKERDQKIDEATSAYRARQQLLAALSDASNSWAVAHRDLAAAVREKRKVSVTELQATVVELKDLVKKVRAL